MAEFQTKRGWLFGLTYRLLGSADEAEDAVQDAFLRWDGADRASIEHPDGWLAKVVTNLCLNRLTAARATRERYVGPWLPEPVPAGVTFSFVEVNGGTAFVVSADDVPLGVVALEFDGSRVAGVRTIANPAKLSHLGGLVGS